jgi:hypothetical protein
VYRQHTWILKHQKELQSARIVTRRVFAGFITICGYAGPIIRAQCRLCDEELIPGKPVCCGGEFLLEKKTVNLRKAWKQTRCASGDSMPYDFASSADKF